MQKQSGIVGTTTTSVSHVASRDKQWDCPQSQQGNVGKGVHGQSHGQTPIQQQQFTNGPPLRTRSKTTEMAPDRHQLVGTRPPQKPSLPRPDLLRLKRQRRMTTTMCTFACRGRMWRRWITGSPRRCSSRFPKALGHRMHHLFFTPFRCSRRQPRHSSGVMIPAPFIPHVSRSCSLEDVVARSCIR